MSNTSNPLGASPASIEKHDFSKIQVPASYSGKSGDTVYLNGAGYPTITRNSAYPIIGAQYGAILTKAGNSVVASGSASLGDHITVTDPREEHVMQVTTGAITDPLTHFTAASRFDVAGSSGVQYIDAGASVYDEVVVEGPANEANGTMSAYGAYQKVYFKYASDKIAKVKSNA